MTGYNAQKGITCDATVQRHISNGPGCFRGVVLYGRNVASYKFALAESLITLASKGKDYFRLEDLAVPFFDTGRQESHQTA